MTIHRWLSGALYSEPTWIWPSVFLVEHPTLASVLLVYREQRATWWASHRIVPTLGEAGYREAANELRLFTPEAWSETRTHSLWTGRRSPTVPADGGAYALSTGWGITMRSLFPPVEGGPLPELRRLRLRYRPVLKAALSDAEIRRARARSRP